MTALHLAAIGGHTSGVQLLIEARADLNLKDKVLYSLCNGLSNLLSTLKFHLFPHTPPFYLPSLSLLSFPQFSPFTFFTLAFLHFDGFIVLYYVTAHFTVYRKARLHSITLLPGNMLVLSSY